MDLAGEAAEQIKAAKAFVSGRREGEPKRSEA
jgi:hypothetical protein